MLGDLKNCTTFAIANTGIAQLVEHWSPKPGVGSSSLSSRASLRAASQILAALLFS